MAQRRMFSLKIVDTDAFLDMPQTSQLLYFHLAMRADDEGFVGNPKKIMRMIGANEDDLKVLLTKRFILSFQSGVVVIKHWFIHNYIQKDRFENTNYLEEKKLLILKPNKSYSESDNFKCIQNVSKMDTQVSIGKVSIDKDITISKEIGKSISYGNENINYLMGKIKELTGLKKLDGSEKSNRRYCWLCLKKIGDVEKVESLIKIALASDFHRVNLTSFKYLYSHCVKIANEFKDKMENPPNVKIK